MNRIHLPRWAALVAIPFLFLACGREGQPESKGSTPAAPSTASRPTNGRPDVPVADLDLSGALPGAPAAGGPMTEADKAWRSLLEAMQPPPFPAAWEATPPSEEQQKSFQRTNATLAASAAERAREFYTKYPDDGRTPEARERERHLLGVAAELGNTNALARLATLQEARLKDPNLTEQERLAVRLEQIQQNLAADAGTNLLARVDELEKQVRALRKEFTNNAEVVGLLLAVAEGRLAQGQAERARALVVEVADAVKDPDIQEAAQAMLKGIQRIGQPLEIKFKALDGRDVDLQSMRGKVVLVDFWATWCGPCMEELPTVKATYEKLHAKGFEVVGISLDQDRKALDRVLAREKIPWPQHMENAPGAVKFSDPLGIESIPTMWLVDKQGKLRDLNAREGLAGKVEKLLAE